MARLPVPAQEVLNQPLADADVAREQRGHAVGPEPTGVLDLTPVDADLACAVARLEAEHERVRKRPRLASEPAHVLDLDPGFLPHLAHNRLLDAFSGLDEAGEHAVDAAREVRSAREEERAVALDGDDHGRREARVEGEAAARTGAR